MALSASAKDYLSRFFPGPPSPLWETDPEFMELFANFALDEVVNQGDLDDAARMMAILAALLGCQGVEEYRVLLPAALRAGVTPVQVKEILYQSVAYLGIGRVRPFFSVTNQVLTEQGVALPLEPGSTTTAETRLAAGNQAQVDIFGEGMRGFQNSGPEESRHINRWLADNCIGIYPDAMEYSLAIRIGLFLHRLCQPGEGKFVAHGQRLEQLLHHLFGNRPDVQPLDEADGLLHFLLGDAVRPQAHGEKQP